MFFKNADFLPNFDNILFIEGIAGSGKTKGVMVTLSKLLAQTNPEFAQSKIFIAHTNKTKADNLGKATEFSNYEAHDHDSLLSFMSPDYKHREQVNGFT
jgi:superfamily I DNA and RNA helicase